MSGSIISTLVFWIIGSFLVYTLSLCFTELGTIFQSAGGPYLYITLIFGNQYGFLVAWGYIILISGPFNAFAAKTASLYLLKAIMTDYDCQSNYFNSVVSILGGCILLGLAFLNCYSLKLIVQVQNFLTACKMLAIGIIVSGGIYILATESTENFDKPTEGIHGDPGRISMALTFVIFSNGGWQAVTTLTEEVKEPAKTLPRAIHLTFAIVVSMFILTYLSYFVVLEKHEMVQSKAVALTFCEHVWPPLAPVMSIFVAVACVGALNTGIMGHSRMLFAAARKGDMPSIMSTLHPTYKTPMIALWTITIYGFVMMYIGDVKELMQFVGLYSLIMGLKVVTGLLYLRYTKPKISRPYKVPLLFPLLQVVVCSALLVLIVYHEPVWMSIGLLIYLAGIPVYLIGVRWTNKPKFCVQIIRKATSLFQKLLKLVPS
ncbi:unnamed protein product [Lymnaea stagnalis]|uniref:Uncharacterized protein n=1 Tax=Lymnaea stagnalis TaxID=6523 RepID=A0AAV2IDN3_LYMST